MSSEPANINSALPLWFPPAMRATEQLFFAFQPPLANRLARFAQRLSQQNGAMNITDGLRAMVATPGPAVLEALREDYQLSPTDPPVQAIGEATLALYFFLRLQDDIVDEQDLFDRADVYAMEIFRSASQRAFARALDGLSEFFAFYEQTMNAFASVATWEVDFVRAQAKSEIDLTRIGQKFLPMAIPLGALALLTQHTAHLEPLTEFVTQLGTGLQIVNDLLNVKEDHASQRRTPILQWLAASGAVTPQNSATQARLALMASDVLNRALDCAHQAMQKAERGALEIGAENLAAIARNRNDYVASVPRRLMALHLQVNDL